jgi:hypothetical protein
MSNVLLLKGKHKGKFRSTATVKTNDEKPICSHCEKKGHVEDRCWKLHLGLKPKWARHQKGKRKTTTIVRDHGLDSKDESKLIAMGLKGDVFIASCSYASTFVDVSHDERKKLELLHIRVISHHTKIDTLVDSGSQVNLIFEDIFKKLGLETKRHPKPYPLGWVHENAHSHVSKQYKL